MPQEIQRFLSQGWCKTARLHAKDEVNKKKS